MHVIPLYFFHVHDGRIIPDVVGTECADLAEARQEAVRRSGRLLADEKGEFWKGDEWELVVTDKTGLVLFTLLFVAVEAPATGRR